MNATLVLMSMLATGLAGYFIGYVVALKVNDKAKLPPPTPGGGGMPNPRSNVLEVDFKRGRRPGRKAA